MKTARITGIKQEFAIGKILCIGRNYVEHIRELGNETPEEPIIFIKPSTSVIGDGEEIVIPPFSHDCHYEAELALLIGVGGKSIAASEAHRHVAGYGIALDLTLRDVQSVLKKKGLPWEIAKGFDTSCPLSAFTAAAAVKDPQDLQIRLLLNGNLRQDGNTSCMIRPITELISAMSDVFTLEAGDVILTGTPAGVGPIHPGDELHAEIPGIASLTVTVR
jgi:5-carboxymethyl-2-hydroxymuconate isomerase